MRQGAAGGGGRVAARHAVEQEERAARIAAETAERERVALRARLADLEDVQRLATAALESAGGRGAPRRGAGIDAAAEAAAWR